MNYLYLIGNGFDLAHRLETKYTDFLFYYLKDAFDKNRYKIFSGDKIMWFIGKTFCRTKKKSLKELVDIILTHPNNFGYNNLFKRILLSCENSRWVDLEYEYYQELLFQYESRNYNAESQHGLNVNVKKLNGVLSNLKNELISYLKNIEKDEVGISDEMRICIYPEGDGEGSKYLFLNFNYTNLIQNYIREDDSLIHIHGQLSDKLSDIVFGYGDEMDPMYAELERLNKNEFLKNFKSFYYLKNSNYQKLIRFVEGADPFEVRILGHSCGISDRVLLNYIFERCQRIRIYYYKKNETENDYFEKTQEISRHFKAPGKQRMRKVIVPFDQSEPMPQVKPLI